MFRMINHMSLKNLYVTRHIVQHPNEICENVQLLVWICQIDGLMDTTAEGILLDDVRLLIVQALR